MIATGDRPFLSIVIPAYNEEGRLPASLQAIAEMVSSFSSRAPGRDQARSIEVLVVDNGSQDGTREAALTASTILPGLRVLSEPRRGKGAAVRTGMLAAHGEYRFLADADLSMPIAQIWDFLPPRQRTFDVAIATREGPGAQRIGEPARRHVMGRVFNFWVRLWVLPGVHDTQCGFKCFTAASAETLFSAAQSVDWSFDIEILMLARRAGLTIVEVPITWHYQAESKVRMFRSSLQMFLGVLRLRRRLGRTHRA